MLLTESPRSSLRRERGAEMILLIFTLIVSLLVAIFAVQNATLVTINFFWYEAEVPLVLVILGSALAGALIVCFVAIWREFRIRGKARAKAKAAAKEQKLAENAAKSTTSESTSPEGSQTGNSSTTNSPPHG